MSIELKFDTLSFARYYAAQLGLRWIVVKVPLGGTFEIDGFLKRASKEGWEMIP